MKIPRAFTCLCLVFVLIISTSGCSSLAPRYQDLTVLSDPEGAEVYLNGERKGVTPVTLEVRRNQHLIVELRKSGYETNFQNLDSHAPSGIGLVDMIFGSVLLLPLLGLASDGAWTYQVGTVAVQMEEKR